MKIFQIFNDIVHYEMTRSYSSAEQARKFYAPDILIVEAPDNVFEGWGYDEEQEGDARFIQPTPPDGFAYDPETGGMYNIALAEQEQLMLEINAYKQRLLSTDYCIIKIAEGAATIAEYDDIIAQRAQWRVEVNALESQLASLQSE